MILHASNLAFSGIECSVLGTFYKNESGKIEFGADVENFFFSLL